MNDHLSGKELFIRFAARAFRKQLSIYVFSYFPFGFEGRMWDLIVSVPDRCLSFLFYEFNTAISFLHHWMVYWSFPSLASGILSTIIIQQLLSHHILPPLVKILLVVFIRWNKIWYYTEKLRYPLFHHFFFLNKRKSKEQINIISQHFRTLASSDDVIWVIVETSEQKQPCLYHPVVHAGLCDFCQCIWAVSWQNQQNDMCAQRWLRSAEASAQSDQCLHCALSGNPRSHNASSCGQRKLWSDCADALADLSLRWAHMSFCWFCGAAADIKVIPLYRSQEF